ncbi:MAG: helix-turn-helix domain-containing protein [Candidatus Accumulibacter meliphilus]|uniref:Helix-turn-helix domain-containing protein n=1 Tax=Candidatus Accumulibacter meliphilus TaxID=2211374 RepID=A0A369XNG3_9PROT|nr:MAG: helix-turn-helix domain-containing protein [Candidatus Accumulibacter meliphilus]
MNPRQLNRLLEREGCTYREILDEARCALALRLMCLTDLSLGQIATVLDYASVSAFTTAANMHDSR